MNTIQMEFFIKTAQLLSFTEAAKQLYVTQPSLSRQIIAIENELAMQLFIRKNNTIQLTQAGSILFEGLKEVYDSYLKTVFAAKQANSGLTGMLRIGLMEDQLFPSSVKAVLQSMLGENPHINIEIESMSTKQIYQALNSFEIDAALSLLQHEVLEQGINSKVISYEGFYLAISKVAIDPDIKSISTNQLSEIFKVHPRIIVSLDSFPTPLQEDLDLQLNSYGDVKCTPIRYVSSPSARTMLISAGLGVGVVNSSHVLSTDPEVSLIKIEFGSKIYAEKGLVWRKDNANPLLPEFMLRLDAVI